jgi:tetratricopeptide (TPR) repeat protein
LGWFNQVYEHENVRWCHGPSVLIVQVQMPGERRLALVVSGEAHLDNGNIARSSVALAFFEGVVGLRVSERDGLIAHALTALSLRDRNASAALVRQALGKFPELESTPDVTLLYLFAQLRLPETEASATAVIRDHPSLPTAWFYYGQYLENSKRYREAAACFEKITMHEPPWHHWTQAAAQKELTYLKTH